MNQDSNVISINVPEDPLQQLLKDGARQLLAQAIEAEVASLLDQHNDETIDGL